MTTREKVLQILSQNIENSVSGEVLAEACGISRAGIWKAVKSLREDGFLISGTTNGGYVLSASSDVITEEGVRAVFLENYPQFASARIECFSEIDSTNSYAKRLLSQAGSLYTADGKLTDSGRILKNSIYVAECQTDGRGRMGRVFYSPSKTGIYLSVIYAPIGGIQSPARLTAFTAVAVCRVIQKLCAIEPKIKWINDIFYEGRKICGILAEGMTNFETGMIDSAVIGIGINILENPEFFPADVREIAGGIGKPVPRRKLAALVAGEVLQILEEDSKKVLEEYRNASFLIGKNVSVRPLASSEEGVYTARAVDIDCEAGLVVQLKDGTTRVLASGEVRVLPC